MISVKLFRSLILLVSVLIPTISFCQGSISIHNARINETPPGVDLTAGYFEIKNSADEEITLTGVSSPDFDRVEMHRSIISDGIAKMVMQDLITIPANSFLVFKPGDYHLMLFQPHKQLTAGDTVSLTFNFSDETVVEVTAVVNQIGTNHDNHNQHKHH